MVSSQDRFTNFLRDMKNVHCFLILRVVAASQDLLRFKNQSSITIAIVGPYGWVDGFRYNGSQVIEGNDTVDIASLSDINNWSTGMWWFWNQQATMLAIDQINKDPKILPNTTIKIKRFNNVRINGSQEVFSESLAPQVAQEIATSHPDVVAAMGELFSRTTLYSNEIYSHFQIPFCGATQADVRLFNMENYPFYFQSFPFSSIVNVYQIILKSLNVTQVAFLCRAPLTLSNTFQSTIISSLQQNGIHVAAAIQHTTVSAEFIADVLEAANIRYIILDSSYAAGSFLYYTLAK
ncbi:periplasmic binding protein-like I [Chytriomyces sp. MP71]|nr:periplasmic binding protein-like I [Chytriomyces sp. MP71]